MATTISTELIDYIGIELQVTGDDFTVPAGYSLPPELLLRSAHRRIRGCYVGRVWYLQSWGRAPAATIDFVRFDDDHDLGDDGARRAEAFLSHHGYVCVDDAVGLYRRD
jgi:hypothetical protein